MTALHSCVHARRSITCRIPSRATHVIGAGIQAEHDGIQDARAAAVLRLRVPLIATAAVHPRVAGVAAALVTALTAVRVRRAPKALARHHRLCWRHAHSPQLQPARWPPLPCRTCQTPHQCLRPCRCCRPRHPPPPCLDQQRPGCWCLAQQGQLRQLGRHEHGVMHRDGEA